MNAVATPTLPAMDKKEWFSPMTDDELDRQDMQEYYKEKEWEEKEYS